MPSSEKYWHHPVAHLGLSWAVERPCRTPSVSVSGDVGWGGALCRWSPQSFCFVEVPACLMRTERSWTSVPSSGAWKPVCSWQMQEVNKMTHSRTAQHKWVPSSLRQTEYNRPLFSQKQNRKLTKTTSQMSSPVVCLLRGNTEPLTPLFILCFIRTKSKAQPKNTQEITEVKWSNHRINSVWSIATQSFKQGRLGGSCSSGAFIYFRQHT